MASRLFTRLSPFVRQAGGARNNSHLSVMNKENRDWRIVKSGSDMIKHEAYEYHHGKHTADIWQKFSLYVGTSIMVIASIHCYFLEKEHYSHERAEFIPYPHTRLRHCGGWPWPGDQSLFHDPRFNAVKEGYEE